ncbi:MAG: hypothetical protein IIU36_01750 [Firmicutes bacterium]|nr:hypothetical protein [Bacillota bacterium]
MLKKVLPIVGVIVLVVLIIMLSGLLGDKPEPNDPGNDPDYVEYTFRNERLLEEHFEKHGIEMGFDSAEEYQKAASDAANDPNALHKLEKEDGDDVYYKEETNEFVVISADGFIRTYFCPDSGKKYFDKQ